ncbi:MAG: tubulin-like doman-containing protein [Candidatus Bipolaricaulia bacterium]
MVTRSLTPIQIVRKALLIFVGGSGQEVAHRLLMRGAFNSITTTIVVIDTDLTYPELAPYFIKLDKVRARLVKAHPEEYPHFADYLDLEGIPDIGKKPGTGQIGSQGLLLTLATVPAIRKGLDEAIRKLVDPKLRNRAAEAGLELVEEEKIYCLIFRSSAGGTGSGSRSVIISLADERLTEELGDSNNFDIVDVVLARNVFEHSTNIDKRKARINEAAFLVDKLYNHRLTEGSRMIEVELATENTEDRGIRMGVGPDMTFWVMDCNSTQLKEKPAVHLTLSDCYEMMTNLACLYIDGEMIPQFDARLANLIEQQGYIEEVRGQPAILSGFAYVEVVYNSELLFRYMTAEFGLDVLADIVGNTVDGDEDVTAAAVKVEMNRADEALKAAAQRAIEALERTESRYIGKMVDRAARQIKKSALRAGNAFNNAIKSAKIQLEKVKTDVLEEVRQEIHAELMKQSINHGRRSIEELMIGCDSLVSCADEQLKRIEKRRKRTERELTPLRARVLHETVGLLKRLIMAVRYRRQQRMEAQLYLSKLREVSALRITEAQASESKDAARRLKRILEEGLAGLDGEEKWHAQARAILAGEKRKTVTDLMGRAYDQDCRPLAKIAMELEGGMANNTDRIRKIAWEIRESSASKSLPPSEVMVYLEGYAEELFGHIREETVIDRLKELRTERGKVVASYIDELIQGPASPFIQLNDKLFDEAPPMISIIGAPETGGRDLKMKDELVIHHQKDRVKILTVIPWIPPFALFGITKDFNALRRVKDGHDDWFGERNWLETYQIDGAGQLPVRRFVTDNGLVLGLAAGVLNKQSGGWYKFDGKTINGLQNLRRELQKNEQLQQRIEQYWIALFQQRGKEGVIAHLEVAKAKSLNGTLAFSERIDEIVTKLRNEPSDGRVLSRDRLLKLLF